MNEDYKKLYEDALDRIQSLEIACSIFEQVGNADWNAYQRMLGIYRTMEKRLENLRKENYALKVENQELKIALNNK